jgi:hypothetical protein
VARSTPAAVALPDGRHRGERDETCGAITEEGRGDSPSLNHPSGDPTPSRADIRLTKQLVEAGRLLDLKVHDHIVIGSGNSSYVSL